MKHLARGFLVSSLLSGAIAAHADTLVYAAVGTGTNAGEFGALDLNTGNFTSLGNLGFAPAGLGEVGSTVYTADPYTGKFYSVNAGTGAVTLISSSLPSVAMFGSTDSGLYEVSAAGELYSVSTSGSATDIGSLGLGTFPVTSPVSFDISTGGNTLYLTNGGSVYSISTSTGAATLIGSLGNSAQTTAMLFENDVLYGADPIHNKIDSINTATGAATLGVGIAGANNGAIWGLAPSPVPLPAGAWLLLSGMVGLGAMSRRRVTA